jgi:hypothetical protein
MSNKLKRKSCADLIIGELQDREQHLRELYALADNGNDQAQEDISELSYGIERQEIIKVIWSGGGPADHLEITLVCGEIVAVDYIYQDWFDGARLAVDESSPVYRYAEDIVDLLAQ